MVLISLQVNTDAFSPCLLAVLSDPTGPKSKMSTDICTSTDDLSVQNDAMQRHDLYISELMFARDPILYRRRDP